MSGHTSPDKDLRCKVYKLPVDTIEKAAFTPRHTLPRRRDGIDHSPNSAAGSDDDEGSVVGDYRCQKAGGDGK